MTKIKYWPIPELWPGETIFIIGGGPSILKTDLSLIQGRRVIGVNQAWKLGNWVDVCWFGDKGWYEDNLPEIKSYGGLIVTCSSETENRRKQVRYVARSKSYGLEVHNRTHIAWNKNSGASAINLAYWLGARRVVLLGFDMGTTEDRTHWHDDYAVKKDKSTGEFPNPYPRFLKGFPHIAKEAKVVGLEIINATIGGNLEVFKRMSLQTIIEQERKNEMS